MLVFEETVLLTNLLGQLRHCLHIFDILNKDCESAMQGERNALGYDV